MGGGRNSEPYKWQSQCFIRLKKNNILFNLQLVVPKYQSILSLAQQGVSVVSLGRKPDYPEKKNI